MAGPSGRQPPKPAAPRPKGKELHFFPGSEQLFWVVDGEVVAKAKARGGEEPIPGYDYGRMAPRKTTPGRYIVHSYAPYTTRTWPMSTVPWGAELKVQTDPEGKETLLYRTGSPARAQWRPINGIPADEIRRQNNYLYHRFDVPDRWVFNDFGPYAVRYFKDSNGNKKLDKGEALSGEMIHTTPDDEAATAQSKPVYLAPSHGCVHVKPVDRDKFHSLGAFAPGTTFVVHPYDETLPKEYQ